MAEMQFGIDTLKLGMERVESLLGQITKQNMETNNGSKYSLNQEYIYILVICFFIIYVEKGQILIKFYLRKSLYF